MTSTIATRSIIVTAFVLAISLWSRSPISAQGASRVAPSAPAASAPALVSAYCAPCHNGRMRSPSGALLDRFDVAQMSSDPALWSRAYRQLQAGTMPPVGARRPDRAAVGMLLVTIEQELGVTAAPQPGPDSTEMAMRLAAMLWNSEPDAMLARAAQREGLRDPLVLERQVQRMLADERAATFVSRFFFPWLQLDQLADADPDTKYFPDYEPSLRDSLMKETELFILSELRDDHDPIELWNARYSYLNEQLARHYAVSNVIGPQFRRVAVPPERAGLLGHGSVLMVTSRHQHGVDAAYTTPATRAKWVRLHFLGAPLPRPFNGAQPVRPELPITPQTRKLPLDPCVTCHRNFFPLGYALENFDPLGRWRTSDQMGTVDASGTFVDGTSTNGVVALREVLLQRPDAFRTTLTERLLTYAAGGGAAPAGGTPDTLTQARRILRGLPRPRWSSLIAAVVQTRPVGD